MSATNRTDLARDVFKAFAAGDRERIESLLAPGLSFHSPPDPEQYVDEGGGTASLHPGHEVAAKQMRRFGGMISFRAAGGEPAAIEICNRARLFVLAESLGGVESLIEHPGRMTHASAAGSPLEVPADLVRLSVGIETVDDLLADLDQALG